MKPHRRESLQTAANPDARHDYLVDVATSTPDGTRLWLRYVPDREVLDTTSVRGYVYALPQLGLEALALTVIDDLANELVPRWVEVIAERTSPVLHRVTIEDRQPDWDNVALLNRLPPLPEEPDQDVRVI